MSNLGFHSLFDRVSSFQGIRVARLFIEKNGQIYSPDSHIPRKRTIFSGEVNARGFDALFFTVSFELDYINILRMFQISSIPLLVQERNTRGPVIVTGGIAPSANPHVLSVFSDVVFIGDMEGRIELILTALFESDFRKTDSLFRSLEEIEGVYMNTGKGQLPVKSVEMEIKKPSHSVILTNHTEFPNRFLIEIIRGCRNTCTFCMTRCTAGPVRPVSTERVLPHVKKALPYTDKVGLIGPVLTDHHELVSLVHEINALGGSVSFSSLRADQFSDEIARLLQRNRQKTVTFAPETGEEGLRRRIGKTLSNDELLDGVSRALAHGIKKFRYYFMYGLPGETPQDALTIVSLVNATVELFTLPGCMLHLSINPFIPKRGTPLEKQRLHPLKYYMDVQRLLKEKLKDICSVTLRFESMKYIYVHSLLSIGDRETAFVLYRMISDHSLSDFARYAEELLTNG